MPRGIYNRKTAKPRKSHHARSSMSRSVAKRSANVPAAGFHPDEILGKSVYQDDKFEVRIVIRDGSVHVYTFRRKGNVTFLPRGFVLGSNALIFKGEDDE